jgi:N-acetylglucosamine malate deacetylase 1
MDRTLVVAPHPDDETLGCGGTLLRRKAEGHAIGWLIVTGISAQGGWPAERVGQRAGEIDAVRRALGFDRVFELGIPAARLDELPLADVVASFAKVFAEFEPTEVLLPHRSDVHTDHRVTFDAVAACTKWFRYPSVRRALAYETLSETDMALSPHDRFQPNVFIDVGAHLERKLEVLQIYASETGRFPFPRSVEAVRALAQVRGAACGFQAAEAFELLRERQ